MVEDPQRRRTPRGTEIYLKTEEGKNGRPTILAWEAKELSIVQIIGPVNLDQLSALGGNFGIPPVAVPDVKRRSRPNEFPEKEYYEDLPGIGDCGILDGPISCRTEAGSEARLARLQGAQYGK